MTDTHPRDLDLSRLVADEPHPMEEPANSSLREEYVSAASTAATVMQERAEQLTSDISREARHALRTSRDELDNLIAQIDDAQRKLAHYISEFARFSAEAIAAARGISAATRKAAEPFSSPPSTITTQRSGSDG